MRCGKRSLLALLAAWCLLPAAGSAQVLLRAADAVPGMTAEQLEQLAYAAARQQGDFLERYPFLDTTVTLAQDADTRQSVWVVSIFLDCGDEPAYTATVDDAAGAVLSQAVGVFLDTPGYDAQMRQQGTLAQRLQAQWEAELGVPYAQWSLEQKYLFGQCYRYHSDAALPTAEDISQAQAEKLACRVLVERYGVSAAELRGMTITYGFWEQTTGRVWAVSFADDAGTRYQVNLDAGDGTVLLVVDAARDTSLG